MFKSVKAAFAAIALVALTAAQTGGATAATFNETADAGDLIGTAADVGSGINLITGTAHYLNVDVFKLFLPAGLFTAEQTAGAAGDAIMVLFDANGIGLRGDDDSGTGVFPIVTETLAGGYYYLAIFGFTSFVSPVDSLAANLWIDLALESNTIPDGPGAANPWAGWAPRATLASDTPYEITLSSTTVPPQVPLPAALPLLAAGVGALGLMGRRLKRKAPAA